MMQNFHYFQGLQVEIITTFVGVLMNACIDLILDRLFHQFSNRQNVSLNDQTKLEMVSTW
jgi:hypothetical protein